MGPAPPASTLVPPPSAGSLPSAVRRRSERNGLLPTESGESRTEAVWATTVKAGRCVWSAPPAESPPKPPIDRLRTRAAAGRKKALGLQRRRAWTSPRRLPGGGGQPARAAGEGLGKLGRAWLGRAWLGRAWLGRAWLGRAWLGRYPQTARWLRLFELIWGRSLSASLPLAEQAAWRGAWACPA